VTPVKLNVILMCHVEYEYDHQL